MTAVTSHLQQAVCLSFVALVRKKNRKTQSCLLAGQLYNQNYDHENGQMKKQISSRYYKLLAKNIQKKRNLLLVIFLGVSATEICSVIRPVALKFDPSVTLLFWSFH